MELLLDNEWKSFRFDEIFTIKGGFYNKKPPFSTEGDIAFIGATNSNNGITGFCKYEDILNCSKLGYGKNHDIHHKIFEGNCITVTNNGSVGYAYYQKNSFTCSHDINILYLNNHVLNEYLAMFLIVCIRQQGICFAYSRKWRPLRMKSSNILLPVDINGDPDYKKMEEYVKELYSSEKKKLITVLKEKLKRLSYMSIPSLTDKSWRDFFITDLGIIKSGKDITKNEMVKGTVPYVSSTSQNNGISAFISNANDTLESDCISINRNGSVGYAFYHPYPALFSNDCRKLITGQNKHVSLFIVNQIKAQKDKYNYGYKMGTNRIKRQKILLPVTKDNEPDYEYMAQYMINIEIKLLKKYLNSIN